jgi:hypothetical protein
MKLVVIAAILFTVGTARAERAAEPDEVNNKGNQSLRKICADAMNADPAFEKAIVEVADKDAAQRRFAATEQEHLDAAAHIAKDEKHVVLAYTAMWLIAAGFVVFLWRRQQGLKAEIAQLRRDLEKEAT